MKFSTNLDANSLSAALYSAWSFQPLDGSNISGLTPGIALGMPKPNTGQSWKPPLSTSPSNIALTIALVSLIEKR